ncbi:MAG: hypothetical protein EP348_05710 [Alphaproteobacteria bacterium]|nr:MAG: hypothetical protein EP348_05710 [Alphaproteobacteria bacterium]
MQEQDFTRFIKEAITYNQLERYFTTTAGTLEATASHFDLSPDLEAIRADQASNGGIKGSNAQRRMLMILVALWQGFEADRLFGEGLGGIGRVIQSMDRTNRRLLSELIKSYPGWG